MSPTEASTSAAPTELEHLILSCYCDDSGNNVDTVSWKDVGKRLSIKARSYFSSLGSSCDNKTKIQLSLQYIALLIEKLGTESLIKIENVDAEKSWSAVCKQRFLGLSVLTGALFGCADLLSSTLPCNDLYESNTQSSTINLIEQIGNFVLLFCAPMQRHENKEAWTEDEMINQDPSKRCESNGLSDVIPCTDEDVRDAAMECSGALLKLPWIPSFMSSSSSSKLNDDALLTDQLESMIGNRMHVARLAVKYRCSSIDYTEHSSSENRYHINGYEDAFEDEESHHSNDGSVNATLSGLSLLVRARRSLCFLVLQNAVDGINFDLHNYHILMETETSYNQALLETNDSTITTPTKTTTSLSHPMLDELISFISFISTCLLGETDPRCLMQMMTLLHHCQISFNPLLSLHGDHKVIQSSYSSVRLNNTIQFPMGEIFDAVAPYYPIQFTPPPNNIHGISRDGLHGALMSVLCYFDPAYIGDSVEDTMMNLSAKLFLERVSSSAGDSTNDKAFDDTDSMIHGLDDLSQLLFVFEDVNASTRYEKNFLKYPRYFFLSEETLKVLSLTLISCHEKASIAFNRQMRADELDRDSHRLIADRCRAIVARIARDIDHHHQSVKNAKDNQSSLLDDKVLYLWQVFISDTIVRCSNAISSSLQAINGRVALAYLASLAACGGIQTLRMVLSTCMPVLINILSSYESVNNDMVTCDEELMSTAAYGISTLFLSSKKTLSDVEKDGLSVHPHPLETYFLEIIVVLCKLTSITLDLSNMIMLQITCVKAIDAILSSTPKFLLDPTAMCSIQLVLSRLTEKAINESNKGGDVEFHNAISHLLGTSIGISTTKNSTTILSTHTESSNELCVWNNESIATFVQTNVLPELLSSSMKKATIKSSILRNTLSDACSFGNLSISTAIISPILDTIRVVLHKRIAEVSLNDTDDEYVMSLVMLLSYIIDHGGDVSRLAFCSLSRPHSTVFDLIDVIAQPAADSDPGMSTLLLPSKQNDLRLIVGKRIYLASRIASCISCVYNRVVSPHHFDQLESYLSRTVPPLTEWDNIKLSMIFPIIATSLTHHVINAASDLTEIAPYLVEYSLNAENNCTTRSHAALLAFAIIERQSGKESICPEKKILVELLFPCLARSWERHIERVKESFDDFADILHLISILGTASATRGNASLQTADEVGLFFAGISCRTQSPASSFTKTCDSMLQVINSVESHASRVASAKAYGLLLNWENGQSSHAMIKQRLAYITLPVILSVFGTIIPEDHLYPLSMLAHIVCNIPMRTFSQSQVDRILLLMINGVGTLSDAHISHGEKLKFPSSNETDSAPLGQLILCAILKILIESESIVTHFIPKLVPSLLLYCTTYSLDVRHTPNLVIALQLLMNFVHLQQDESSSYCKRLKNSVLMHLSSLIFHPSLHIRQSSIQVRNVWALLL